MGELEGYRNNINIMFIILISILLYQNSGEAFFVGVLSALLFSGVIWLTGKIRQHRNDRKNFDFVSREETTGVTNKCDKSDKPIQTDSQKKESHDNPPEELGDGVALLVFVIVVIIAAIIGALNV